MALLRGALAVLAGIGVFALALLAMDATGTAIIGAEPEWINRSTTTQVVWALGNGVSMIAGGYVAAWIAPGARVAHAVIVGSKWKAWRTMPMRPRRARASASSFIAAKSAPATFSVPLPARSSPESTAISELLPEPEGPRSASVWPAGTTRSMPLRICTEALPLPSASVRPCAAMAGGGLVTTSGWHSYDVCGKEADV